MMLLVVHLLLLPFFCTIDAVRFRDAEVAFVGKGLGFAV